MGEKARQNVLSNPELAAFCEAMRELKPRTRLPSFSKSRSAFTLRP